MWFEILPSFGIIAGILAVPGLAMYHIHDWWGGNVSRKTKKFKFM
jgi:hypothetical protein